MQTVCALPRRRFKRSRSVLSVMYPSPSMASAFNRRVAELVHYFLGVALVWRLDVDAQPLTLHEAIYSCAHKGQGGPTGAMGWRLPTAAELTSLDGEQWRTQRDAFEKYQLPPMVRTETSFWTTTPWPPEPDAWAVVMFSARTTISAPSKKDTKAGA